MDGVRCDIVRLGGRDASVAPRPQRRVGDLEVDRSMWTHDAPVTSRNRIPADNPIECGEDDGLARRGAGLPRSHKSALLPMRLNASFRTLAARLHPSANERGEVR